MENRKQKGAKTNEQKHPEIDLRLRLGCVFYTALQPAGGRHEVDFS